MRSNGKVERPCRSAGLAPRAHTFFQRPRRPTPCASRPVPTLVRGRPHQPTVRARNLQRKPKLTGATNPHRPAEAQPRQSAATSAGLACWPHGPPACAQAEALSEGSWPSRLESGSRLTEGFLPRPLTVKLRGRVTAPDQSRGCTLFSSTRGDTTALHGPLQRLLCGACAQYECHDDRKPNNKADVRACYLQRL